jgi:polar amino acid transport system permease protein
LLLQVYLIYLGLPQIGLTLPAIPSGVIALSLNYGAYMAEIFRAGIEGVPAGQREAARSLGLREHLILSKIVLPQAMRLIVPPVGNQFIQMLKDSSLVSVMGVWELTFVARTAGRAQFRHLEMLITAALIYWILSIVFELIQVRLEAYYGKGYKR